MATSVMVRCAWAGCSSSRMHSSRRLCCMKAPRLVWLSAKALCRWRLLQLSAAATDSRSEEHTSELQSQSNLVCRLLLEKKKKHTNSNGLVVSGGTDTVRADDRAVSHTA